MSAAHVFTDSPNPTANNENCQAKAPAPQVMNEAVQAANTIVNNGFPRDPAIFSAIKRDFSLDERADFYSGEERHTLQKSQVQRVRELHEMNDELQRQVINKRRDLATASDQLSLVADMEHCSILIARNTGEILKIYNQNEARLKRIAQLETQNYKLKEEIMNVRDSFITHHDIQQRTKFAAEFFTLKDTLEKNNAELYELNQD